MRSFQKILFSFLVLSVVPAHAEKPEHRKLAEYYAPVLYQETKSAVLDSVTKFDFDGDWNGANNEVVVNYIIFDRNSFSDTFER